MAVAETSYMTLDEAKSVLGITGSSLDDELTIFVDAASEAVDNYCNRKFAYVAAEEERLAAPRYIPYFMLQRAPLVALTSIYDLESSTTLVENTDYEIEDSTEGLIRLLRYLPNTGGLFQGVKYEPAPATFKRRYRVTYEGGFETPNQMGTGAIALPPLLRIATRTILVDAWRSRQRDPQLSREHLVEASYWYDHGLVAKKVGTHLDRYRRLVQA